MTEHYFSETQSSESNPEIIHFAVRGRGFEFYTDSGVFSRRKLDKAARLLIDSAIVNYGERILDLGCAWGPVGICLKKFNPTLDVTLSDVNLRALKVARMNRKHNGVEVSIINSDGFKKIKGVFDTVLFNPPQTAGKIVWQRLIEESKDFCKTLQVVARHNKGGKSISLFMEKIYGNVDVVDRSSGYRIYISKNKGLEDKNQNSNNSES